MHLMFTILSYFFFNFKKIKYGAGYAKEIEKSNFFDNALENVTGFRFFVLKSPFLGYILHGEYVLSSVYVEQIEISYRSNRKEKYFKIFKNNRY